MKDCRDYAHNFLYAIYFFRKKRCAKMEKEPKNIIDNFAEYLVKKWPDSQDRMKRAGIIVAIVLLSAVSVWLSLVINLFILFITVAIIYGGYYLLTGLRVEYEYAVTNDELDVDKIIDQRKRVHLITVNIAAFEVFGSYDDDVADKPDATLVLCSDNTGEGAYYADLTTEEYGETRLVFTPNKKMIEAIHAALSPQLRLQLDKDVREA